MTLLFMLIRYESCFFIAVYNQINPYHLLIAISVELFKVKVRAFATSRLFCSLLLADGIL